MPATAGFQPQGLVTQNFGQPGLHEVHQQQVSSGPTQEQQVLRSTLDPATMRALESVGEAIHTGEMNRINRYHEKFKYNQESKIPPELRVGDKVDLYKATVGAAPFRAIDGATLSAPTSISKGMSDIYRASQLVPKLQAERLRGAEAMKKGGNTLSV